MKKSIGLLVGTSCLGFTACDVDQTKEGKAPEVDVNVSGGQLPEYNVQGPDVDVGTVNKTVQVPTVERKAAAKGLSRQGGQPLFHGRPEPWRPRAVQFPGNWAR